MNERAHHHPVYVISVFAELAGVHPQTLRNYERSGLLNPQRTMGGSRRFSDEDLAALRRIQELTSEGVNLEGVKRILQLEAQVEELRASAAAISEAARQHVEATHRQYRRDLVPVSNTIALFFDARRQTQGDS
ncbi:MAG TPA: MerR family transcriptional regulator [Acidimicrobiales bacterium]|nr:MAG: MerR family transcriptional regulator [Actinobacteria bacterium 21-64-8]HQT99075.1 MerR family transcriptional regulator [Acidimicrobiales bacterium]